MATKAPPSGLLAQFSETYGLTQDELRTTLVNTVFPNGKATIAQVFALLAVAHQYRLNPFAREIYAFPGKGGGIVPVMGVDGWYRLATTHPQFAGIEAEPVYGADEKLVAYRATVWRQDCQKPLVVVERLDENKRNTDNWKSMPNRMLRHRALVQAIRVAFGVSGIYEPDEAAGFAVAREVDAELPDDSAEAAVQAAIDADAESERAHAALRGDPEPTESERAHAALEKD